MGRLTDAARTTFGAAPAGIHRLHGGDLSEVHLLVFDTGRRMIAKIGPLVDREARMLRAIGKTGAAAPAVLGVTGDILFLEEVGDVAPDGAWQSLGETLARLHAATGPSYGWNEDYAFGKVEIGNAPLPDWPSFWTERRLMAAPAALPTDLARRVEALAARMAEMLPRTPPAALLHGDLWMGNIVFGARGAAYLIDPACYYGHAEVDLAMLHLFGTPSAGLLDGYGPLEPGWQDRRAVYQLWPALVHLRLFGDGYRSLVESRLDVCGA